MRNLFLLLSLITITSIICSAEDTASITGKPAPMFRLPNQNTATQMQFNLADQFLPDSQHAVVVSFFATWCVPCRLELPFLQHAADSLAKTGLRLVAVCVDTVYEIAQKKMVKDLKLTCPVILDKYGIVARRYACGKALPYTVFIKRNGVVFQTSIGYNKMENKEIIDKLQIITGSNP